MEEEVSILFCTSLVFDDCGGPWVVNVYHDHQTALEEASKLTAEEAKLSDQNDEPIYRAYFVKRHKVK